jgi:hypothetical protein
MLNRVCNTLGARAALAALMLVFLQVGFLFAQWETDVRLTNNTDSSFTSYNNAWCVAAHGDTVDVVWYDNRDGNYEIYYKRSSDGGATWGPDARLTNEPSGSYNPSIAVAGSDIHVVWEDERNQDIEVYHKCSTDGGVTWGPDVQVSTMSGPQAVPSVAVVAGCVYVAFVDFSLLGNSEIYFCRSVDGGTTWDSAVQISYAAGFSSAPSIAASGSNVHIAWEDSRLGWWNSEIFYRRSTNDGVNWSIEQQLTDDTTFSNTPSIAVSGNNIHVAWQDMRDGNFEIYYKNSTDNGQTWITDMRLTNNAGDSYYPSAAASGSNVHITWQDNRDGNDEIYYKVSNDYGMSWDPDIRLTDDQSTSQNASIAVAGQKVHVVWTDERDGNWEIYYKRNPTGNTGINELTSATVSNINLIATPNPFHHTTEIRYSILGTGYQEQELRNSNFEMRKPTLKIYDVGGRLARVFNPESCIMDHVSTIRWDGTDQADRRLGSGVYFVKLESGGLVATEKVLLVR